MESNFSKEAILGRMLSSAADLWGINNNENLDPIVKLMIEAFATEIFNLQQNMELSNARLVEHLAEALTPTKLVSVVPAHGVIHAGCNLSKQTLEKDVLYEIIAGKGKEQKLFFTPIDHILVYNAEITDMINPYSCCKLDRCIYKITTGAPKAGSIPQNHLWLGLNVSNQLHDLTGLSFFVDWPNLGSKNELYKSMGSAKWSIEGTIPLQMNRELLYAEADSEEEDLIKKLEVHNLVVDDIKNSYQNQFFTITNGATEIQEKVKAYPEVFKNYFSEEQLTQFFGEKKLWLRIESSVYLEAMILNDMLVTTNAFPVINRELKVATTNTTLLPLLCEGAERILSVEEIYGTLNGPYKRIELREAQGSFNTYTVKNSGLERFDKREAYQVIKYLELLVKNEAQAFASTSKDNSQDLLNALNSVMAQVNKFSKAGQNKSALQYIILEKENVNEVVTAEFWVTRCEEANHIKMGTPAQNVKDSSQPNCILLTPTTGGKDNQSEQDRIRAYQYALITKEQIVSEQDIKSFIHYHLGDQVAHVEVRNGLMIGQGSKHGLMRSMDIYITTITNNKYKEDTTEQKMISDTLLQKLQQQSDPARMYRLFWNESVGTH